MHCSSKHSFDQADVYYNPQLHNSGLTKVNKTFLVKISQTYEMQTLHDYTLHSQMHKIFELIEYDPLKEYYPIYK